MSLFAYNSNVPFTAPLVLSTGDTVVVGAQGFVYSQSVLFVGQFSLDFLIAGAVVSWGEAIILNPTVSNPGSNNILLTSTGLVQGNNAIVSIGPSLDLSNAGVIKGDSNGLILTGMASDGAIGSWIVNSGTISGSSSGISDGASLGFANTTGGHDGARIDNSGLIAAFAEGTAIRFDDLGIAHDILRNSGLILGDVRLGGGNDLYEARGTGEVIGTVYGGAGNDRFRPGFAEETLDGGAGTDVLDFTATSGIAVALDASFDSTGVADGDVYLAMENVLGSRTGADRIMGNSADNRIVSRGGNDSLGGGAGNDRLEGGYGSDTLTGGAGNDSFVYLSPTEGRDQVTDFSSATVGNNDNFRILASGFEGGLVAGALSATRFQSRTDNLAQDANDRFIFRTTDTTLWFDKDGTGTAAPVMLADLQSGATMTAADFLLI